MSTEGTGPRRPRFGATSLTVAMLLAGVLGLLAAVLIPFAPVSDHDTTVTWPKAGQAPASTTAFFVPYAPESVRVSVPCPVVRAGLAPHRATPQLAAAKTPADTPRITQNPPHRP
ncbi:MAG: hypothetical protein L0I76_38140, partial [Pseudonocardia sp.]|nr:hypothetical protein [Pseudonocardia sp.]